MRRTELDGFSGALMAAESFTDGLAVLHGPGGCRNYHSFISNQFFPRKKPDDSIFYSGDFFLGQPRLPCTFIDETDYINGSEEKLRRCVEELATEDRRFSVFIESPAAALIGDDIAGIIDSCGRSDTMMTIEESMMSLSFPEGYDHTITSILEWISPEERTTCKRSVNLIGLPISSKDWMSSVNELTHILNMMGIDVISSPGCGLSRTDAKISVSAEANIIVCPEYCNKTARFYESEYGIPSISSDSGAPVGYDALIDWAAAAAEILNVDPSPVESAIESEKKDVFLRLDRSLSSPKLRYRRFAVSTESSVMYPLSRWLYDYLSMIPVSMQATLGSDPVFSDKTKRFLEGIDMADAWNLETPERLDFAFTDGHTARSMELMGLCRKGIDIMPPSLSRVDMIPRPIFGLAGARYILDEVINGLWFRRWTNETSETS